MFVFTKALSQSIAETRAMVTVADDKGRVRAKIPIRFLICLYCVRLPFSGLDRNQMHLAKITRCQSTPGTETMKLFLDQFWTAFVMNK